MVYGGSFVLPSTFVLLLVLKMIISVMHFNIRIKQKDRLVVQQIVLPPDSSRVTRSIGFLFGISHVLPIAL